MVSKVGLSLEVDSDNLIRNEYVTVKIECKDLFKVPTIVDGLLDFHFFMITTSKEVPQEGYTNLAANKWIRNEVV